MSSKRIQRIAPFVCSACRRHAQLPIRSFTTSSRRTIDIKDGEATDSLARLEALANQGDALKTPPPAGEVENATEVKKTPPTKEEVRAALSSLVIDNPGSRAIKPGSTFRSRQKDRQGLRDILGSAFGSADELAGIGEEKVQHGPHRLHVYAHKHNTHLTLVQSSRLAMDTTSSSISRTTAIAAERKKKVDVLLTKSTGDVGYKRSQRSTYDAAFQLGAYFLEQMKERGMYRDLSRMEVIFRGFGPGREAIQKIILGPEGRFLKDRIISVADATRLKIGGCRSRKPRRLG